MKLLLFTIWGFLFLTACQKDNDDEIKHPPEITNELIIDPGSIQLVLGESYQLVAKLNGKQLKESEVCWESNSNMVSADNHGKVKAVLHDEFLSGLAVTATMQE